MATTFSNVSQTTIGELRNRSGENLATPNTGDVSSDKSTQIANWNGHTFEVGPALIRSFTDLTIKGSCETTDKNSDKQKYVERKYGEAAQISMTVGLNALIGVTDVYKEAMAFVKEATDGATGYFYMGTSKLVPAKMMLISAEIVEVVNMPGNGSKWISCDVKLTFKQGSKNDGSSTTTTTSGTGSQKASVKTQSWLSSAIEGIKNGVTAGINAAKDFLAKAKSISAEAKGGLSGLAKGNALVGGAAKAVTASDSAKKTNATTGKTATSSGLTASKPAVGKITMSVK